MSILIKGMRKPRYCWTCPFMNGEYGEYSECDVDGLGRDPNEPKLCPLIELPPHGRLIDEDDVREQIDEWLDSVGYPTIGKGMSYYWELLGCVKDAPTIIEAEGKGYIPAPQEEYDGLKRKYVVLKSDTGECVENCFVLRPDKDKAAIAALLAYADATDNQVLAKDIRAWISTIQAEEGE